MRRFIVLTILLFTACGLSTDETVILISDTPIPPSTPLPASTALPAATSIPPSTPLPASTALPAPTAVPIKKIFPDDYSDNPYDPSIIGILDKDTTISNIFGDNNRDYVGFTVKENFFVEAINLIDYYGQDKIAFFAIQKNDKFTAEDDITKMLSYGHFGPESNYNKVGQNILYYSKNMDSNRDKVVLDSGDYVMRIQQGNSENASYEFKLIIRAKNK